MPNAKKVESDDWSTNREHATRLQPESNLQCITPAKPTHRARPDRSVQGLLVELIHEVRTLSSKTQQVPTIKTEVPLAKKEAAMELGLKLKEFNTMVSTDQLVDGKHFIAMGESIILLGNVLEILCEDRLKKAEYAPKPSQIAPAKTRGTRKKYIRNSK